MLQIWMPGSRDAKWVHSADLGLYAVPCRVKVPSVDISLLLWTVAAALAPNSGEQRL